MKLKIFLDATSMTDYPSGVSIYCENLISNLLLDKELYYTILLNKKLKHSPKIKNILNNNNVELIFTNIPSIGPLRDLKYFFIKNKIKECNIYHCLSSYLPFFGTGIFSIVTIHDLKHLRNKKLINNFFKSTYLNIILKRTIKKSHNIISVSKFTSSELIDFNCDENKINIIGEGVNFGNIDKAKVDQMYNFQKENYIFCVGNNVPNKNYDKIITVFKKILKINNKYKLVIAGKNTKNLKDLLPKEIISNIHLLGFVTDNELHSLYKFAKVFLYPSKYEGFGLPILEAMYFNCPVITSKNTASEEISGNASYLIDPNKEEEIYNAIKNLISNHKLRNDLIILGNKNINRYNWSKASTETINLYKSLNQR